MIYKLKVKRSQVGKVTPFPLLYLFPASLTDQMKLCFHSFIGFSVRHAHHIKWDAIQVDTTVSGVTSVGSTKRNVTLPVVITDLKRKEDPWHAAVPIMRRYSALQKYRRSGTNSKSDPRELYEGLRPNPQGVKGKSVPGYLKDDKWDTKVKGSAYPTTAYYVINGEVFAPTCTGCPRLPFHAAGECSLGDRVCFETMKHDVPVSLYSKIEEYDKFVSNLPLQRGDQ